MMCDKITQMVSVSDSRMTADSSSDCTNERTAIIDCTATVVPPLAVMVCEISDVVESETKSGRNRGETN
jgi:hypothetical protein